MKTKKELKAGDRVNITATDWSQEYDGILENLEIKKINEDQNIIVYTHDKKDYWYIIEEDLEVCETEIQQKLSWDKWISYLKLGYIGRQSGNVLQEFIWKNEQLYELHYKEYRVLEDIKASIDSNNLSAEGNKKSNTQINKERGNKMKTIKTAATTIVEEAKEVLTAGKAPEMLQGKLIYSNLSKAFGRTIVNIPVVERLIAKFSTKMRLKNEAVQLGATLILLVGLKQAYDHKLLEAVRAYIIYRLGEILIEATGMDDLVDLVQGLLSTISRED